MTRRDPLPTDDAVRAALDHLRAEAQATGRVVSILALARRVGLPNTTLRRRFPELCTELAANTRTPPVATTGNTNDRLAQDNAKLRRDNHDLTEHLELAIANIQRLTIDNQALREALEAARNVTRLPTKAPMRG